MKTCDDDIYYWKKQIKVYEEVDYGSFASIANPDTDSDRSWTPL